MSGDDGIIPANLYKKIIDAMPILCVDVVIRSSDERYLLVKRKNEPLKGCWWVVGGRVHKGESLSQAVIRKVQCETSLQVKNLRLLGYHEQISAEHPLNPESRTHAVSIVFSTEIGDVSGIKLDEQSSDWMLSDRLPAGFNVVLVGGS